MYVRYVLVQYNSTVQEHNKRTSTEFILVTPQSTAHELPEDGRKYGPKHVGASFKSVFKCFKYWCELVFLKWKKVCMSWNERNNCSSGL